MVTESNVPGSPSTPASMAGVGCAVTEIDGQQYLRIEHVDRIRPFLMSIISSGDQWLFVGSNGSFSAGRVDPDSALFPYQTVDKLLRYPDSSGAISLFRVGVGAAEVLWEPWIAAGPHSGITRTLYKHVHGTGVVFEEVNEGLGLQFTWSLTTSEAYGFVRHCRIANRGAKPVAVRYLDGWNHMIPPGVSKDTYAGFSYLAAGYMRHECVPGKGLGIYTLNARMSDRAEPSESLRSACAWSLGHRNPVVLLSSRQVDNFRSGHALANEHEIRGDFGAYLVADSIVLPPGQHHEWVTVADTRLDHAALVRLDLELEDPERLHEIVSANVRESREALRRKIAAADGLQQSANSCVGVHHFANVAFNCMRGGTLNHSYWFPSEDFALYLQRRNGTVFSSHREWLGTLPEELTLGQLRELAADRNDVGLQRLAGEYLPLTFSRRHGDPSRPWNRFSIHVKDDSGRAVFGYQGNWRDIFQNWESLAQSYPSCLESMIAIFLNASTADGYNPYRITREGIDWEVMDPEDPWSHIGYWGDHQIVYLLRLLESSEHFHPGTLTFGLNRRLYSYARIPYVIAGFSDLVRDPRHSIAFDDELHRELLKRSSTLGNDGKLMQDKDGSVLLVSLAEKLLVPLIAKLTNLVPEGGIWMNTQRPEWNDANNALAGWGLSMVTVYHLRRYVLLLRDLFAGANSEFIELSHAVGEAVLDLNRVVLGCAAEMKSSLDDQRRFEIMAQLGAIGERHRGAAYGCRLHERQPLQAEAILQLLDAALIVIDQTIGANRRPDGLYHSYNLLGIAGESARVENMVEMLEGQVAVLGSTYLSGSEALDVIRALRTSRLYRKDQHSYLLYPDREVAPVLSRNKLRKSAGQDAPLLAELVAAWDRRLVSSDIRGDLHFHADLTNARDLNARLDLLEAEPRWAEAVARDRQVILELWEEIFHHSAFTGRSGSMFAFEGLGSIYWHMVAKLLLAVQECHSAALGHDPVIAAALGDAYFDIRSGLGFTKSPEIYGAFPSDPYSHSPAHAGAQQPGMTGQVKEEILTRFGELGVAVVSGRIRFAPTLLRLDEFFRESHQFDSVSITGVEENWPLPGGTLAFTYCQVPICYKLGDTPSIHIERMESAETIPGNALSRADSLSIFRREGKIRRITVGIPQMTILP